jgi:adenylate kinase family enzyme
VPFLTANDQVPGRPQRVLVAGMAGAGKTTLAARLAEVLGVPHVEIDALHHGPGWTVRDEFERDVVALTQQPTWVTEWQYDAARPLLAERADLAVWLDLPVAVVMWRITRRTVRRRLRRQVLWNGNVEPPLRTILTDRDHVIRWAWKTRHDTATRIADLAARRPELVVVHLSRLRDVETWLSQLARSLAGGPGGRVSRSGATSGGRRRGARGPRRGR